MYKSDWIAMGNLTFFSSLAQKSRLIFEVNAMSKEMQE